MHRSLRVLTSSLAASHIQKYVSSAEAWYSLVRRLCASQATVFRVGKIRRGSILVSHEPERSNARRQRDDQQKWVELRVFHCFVSIDDQGDLRCTPVETAMPAFPLTKECSLPGPCLSVADPAGANIRIPAQTLSTHILDAKVYLGQNSLISLRLSQSEGIHPCATIV